MDPTMIAAMGTLAGSGGAAMVAFFLKDFFSSTKKDLHELTVAVTAQVKEISGLTYECKTQARDLSKLEGVIENQQRQLGQSIKETATLLANIKALWTALERIHPSKFPGRLSDETE